MGCYLCLREDEEFAVFCCLFQRCVTCYDTHIYDILHLSIALGAGYIHFRTFR